MGVSVVLQLTAGLLLVGAIIVFEAARSLMPLRRWIVDGMNVIGSRPTGWWRDRPGAMRELVEKLTAFAERSGEPVTVIFDGEPFDLEGGQRVTARFASRRGRTRPTTTSRRSSSPTTSSILSVATSDADLARRVRAAGATVVGAGQFRRLLDG